MRAFRAGLRRVVFGLALVSFPVASAFAEAPPCRWNRFSLVCEGVEAKSEGGRAMGVLRSLAMSDPDALFGDPFASDKLETRPIERERYRRRMEALHHTIERARRAIEWRRRHDRFQPGEYADWMTTYKRALSTYREGVWFYKSLHWATPDA